MEEISNKIVKNTIFNISGTLWVFLVSLILTPYIIGHVGITQYGIWAIIGIITGYFGLFDFGIRDSFVKYISQFYATEEYGKINSLINTGIIFYALLGVLIVALVWLLIDPILIVFNIPAEYYDDAKFIMILGAGVFCLSNTVCAFSAIQSGLQRMDVTNKISIAVSFPMIAGTVFFMESGYGLPGLMVNNLLILLISTVANVYISYRLLPELRINPFLFSRQMLGKLFGFGYKLQFAKFADMITFQADRLMIAYFLNMNMVGFYQLGSTMTQTARTLPLLLVSAILPAASEIHAARDLDKLRELYLRGTKYLAFISTPFFLFIVVSANIIMLAWMGPGYGLSVMVVQFLAIGYYINLMTGVATSIGNGIGKPEIIMRAALITVVSNIVLSVLLITTMGMLGIVIATAVSISTGPIYYFYRFHKEIGTAGRNVLGNILMLPAIASAIPGIMIFVLYHVCMAMGFTDMGRIANIVILAIGGLIYMAVYLLLIARHGYFDEFDLHLAGKYFGNSRILSILKIQVKG